MNLALIFGFALVCFLPALLTSVLVTALLRKLAPKIGLLDQPSERKVHTSPTPLGGGIGIWAGVLIPVAMAQLGIWLVASNEELREKIPAGIGVDWNRVLENSGTMWGILLAGTLLAAMGLLDDKKNLSWFPRLLVQLLVVVGVVGMLGVRATVFAQQTWIGFLFSVLWMGVLINAFNFLDNMDGLTSGIGFISALLFAAVMLLFPEDPRWLVGGVLLVLAGSLGGFLFFHNWPPARIFMGDAGSMFIGFMISAMTILGTFYKEDVVGRHVMLAPLCILAIPLYDFVSVIFIRLKQGRSPFHPDKSHFSHRLVELGLKPKYAVLTIHLATWTTGLGGLILYQVENWAMAIVVLGMVGCTLAIIAILETKGRANTAKK